MSAKERVESILATDDGWSGGGDEVNALVSKERVGSLARWRRGARREDVWRLQHTAQEMSARFGSVRSQCLLALARSRSAVEQPDSQLHRRVLEPRREAARAQPQTHRAQQKARDEAFPILTARSLRTRFRSHKK